MPMDFVTPCNSFRLLRLACGINQFRLYFRLFNLIATLCSIWNCIYRSCVHTRQHDAWRIRMAFQVNHCDAFVEIFARLIALIVLLISCRCHFCLVSPLSSQHGSILNSWDTGHPHLMKKSKLHLCRNPWILLSFIWDSRSESISLFNLKILKSVNV